MTPQQLFAFSPSCAGGTLAPLLNAAMQRFQINSPLRVQHFMAQIAHESAGLTIVRENLNYSAQALHSIWPSRFPTVESAELLARKPEQIANAIYGGRMGNTQPGDGWLFRGRGFIQITGRNAYSRISQMTGLDLLADPELAATSAGASMTAAAFWAWQDCNTGADADNIETVTKRINGGLIGLSDRQAWLNKARAIFK